MARQRVQLRRDTAAAWAAANPVLLAGEAGIETDTNRFKFGNGSTAWNALSYSASGANTLAALSDVEAATRVDGSVLVYDGATAKFVASPLNTKLTLADGGNF
jgi:hypothetical protein